MTVSKTAALASALILLSAQLAHAGTATGLNNYQVDQSDITLNMSGSESPNVPCNTLHLFVAKANGTYGRNVTETVNSAAAGHLIITAIGSGKCTNYPGAEDLAGVGIAEGGSKPK